MKLISAIALDRPREVTTKYGQRLVIDAMNRDTGEKFPLWRGVDDEYSRKYVIKNSPLTVGIDGKGKYSLIEDPALANLGQPLPPELPVPVKPVQNTNHVIEKTSEKTSESELTADKKREIASYIQEMSKLYGFCLQQAENLNLEGEDRRCVATSLWIQATKHFNL
ncbi:hypothetical protein [Microcystis aeruginosa]|jgi:hypothetical protein|uniref:hypothetical protein n=1 Tax=Microcystis aeruginosa TaxID=1126 RepID=UPI001191CDD9|nr:hypothetical protein [Microcystis aeruginosa]MBE8996194.1 hypothetical protein [Microcystis aeruginosa LEGE 91341]TRT98794.1 MAG: hypothetical protein EWV61_16720 [Microcystis aeruginosa Ma_AC_P_19900807_S300]